MDDFTSLAAPSADEKTMALLAHVLQIALWWIGPLVIFLAKRESKFTSFHAMQALLWQVAVVVLGGLGFVFLILTMVFTIPHSKDASGNQPPIFFFVFVIFFYGGFIGAFIANIVFGVVYGMRAGRGEWAEYPLLGRWARRIVGL